MPEAVFDINEAIVLLLRRYPGENDLEFEARYGADADAARKYVALILAEAVKVEPDWKRLTLDEAGN